MSVKGPAPIKEEISPSPLDERCLTAGENLCPSIGTQEQILRTLTNVVRLRVWRTKHISHKSICGVVVMYVGHRLLHAHTISTNADRSARRGTSSQDTASGPCDQKRATTPAHNNGCAIKRHEGCLSQRKEIVVCGFTLFGKWDGNKADHPPRRYAPSPTTTHRKHPASM